MLVIIPFEPFPLIYRFAIGFATVFMGSLYISRLKGMLQISQSCNLDNIQRNELINNLSILNHNYRGWLQDYHQQEIRRTFCEKGS